jgi:hypothetical protein
MRRHDIDALSLVFGLLFTVVGLLLLSGDPAGGTVLLPWAGPGVVIGVGLLVVLAARPPRVRAVGQQPLDVEQ